MEPRPLPTDAEAILALTWSDYEPFYQELESRLLNNDNIEAWLADWSRVAETADEQYWRLYIATTVDTANPAVEEAFNAYIETIQPAIKIAEQKLKDKLVASGLSPESFETALRRMRAETEIFTEENLPLLAEEQKLVTEYNKLIGSLTVLWDGEERTFWQMRGLLYETDRSVRQRAWEATYVRLIQERQNFNDLWENFMPVRLKIAENAGMSDYRAYMWKQKFRFDYSPEDCKSFHAAIEEVIVPAAQRAFERRRQRLGIDTVRPWDVDVDPLAATPVRPYETIDEFKSKSRAIFEQVDPKFGEYFQIMIDEGLLDLESRKNKGPGAYSLGLHVAHRPFVFMNNMNTSEDVQTMLHEGGHAFHEFERAHVHFYQRGEIYLPAEFAEVASIGMELIASPYKTKECGGFYTESEAARAMIELLEGCITFWPYMALVDAFQHWIYENPEEGSDASTCEEKWAELWDRFQPGIDYSGVEDAKKTYWHRQSHLFDSPFYYIEYGLAQLGAVQVWANSLKDQRKAVADYRTALALGATVPLPQLFATAGAKFAFDAQTLKEAVDLMEEVIGEMEAKL
ncbi:MAG TPA: M3 family oligoendopeptidase [Anaerolineales bacterium]|jgi:oligoendopeptidase F|nr:M3 family oligoendopeptidase [Anaerolineales bacterium]